MKTVIYILDDQWAKVVSGEMSIEDWKAQAKIGPELYISEEKEVDLEKVIQSTVTSSDD